jgi:hypothetical protein
MIWQDIVIMISCFGFAFALIPTIRSINKPPKSTCLLTIFLLSIVAISFATLHLWLSFASELTGITAWAIVYFQKRK